MLGRVGLLLCCSLLLNPRCLLAQADLPLPKSYSGTWKASGNKAAVAAGGQKSVDAGMQILAAGGNAADAAAATILALTVTDSSLVCFGGEVPILYYDAKTKTVEVIAGQGVAPRLATREHFLKQPDGIPAKGIQAATVPALLDAVLVLLERHGTMTFSQVVEPTLKLLEAKKEPWHSDLEHTLNRLIQAESSTSVERKAGLRRVADYFYRGPIAWEIDTWAKSNGALIRYSDLATHITRVEEPLSVTYRRWTIFKCGAWTQAPMLLQAMQLLERSPLPSLGRLTPEAIHWTVEAMKLSLADRDSFLGDPLFSEIPVSALLSPAYADVRRKLIDPKKASEVRIPGDPLAVQARLDPSKDRVKPAVRNVKAQDTTTCITADEQGNVVSATPSGWSGVVAGSTGVWLGSRLQSFNLWEGHPNMLEPGKRPRITLTPTLVLNDQQRPVVALSVAGGDNQDQLSVQLLVDLLDFGREPADTVRSPRFLSDHLIGSFRQTPVDPAKLRINPSVGSETLNALKSLGHRLEVRPGPLAAAPVVLSIDPEGKSQTRYRVAGDPAAGRHVGAQ